MVLECYCIAAGKLIMESWKKKIIFLFHEWINQKGQRQRLYNFITLFKYWLLMNYIVYESDTSARRLKVPFVVTNHIIGNRRAEHIFHDEERPRLMTLYHCVSPGSLDRTRNRLSLLLSISRSRIRKHHRIMFMTAQPMKGVIRLTYEFTGHRTMKE